MANTRIGTEDRTRVIDVLTTAFALGYLPEDEYASRVKVAQGAYHASEVQSLTSDLPDSCWEPDEPVAVVKPTRKIGPMVLRVFYALVILGALTLGVAGIVAASQHKPPCAPSFQSEVDGTYSRDLPVC